MATISISREELLTMLQKAKAKAEKVDAANAAAHAKEEQKSLEKFRGRLKIAMRMTYAEVKKHLSDYDNRLRLDSPACPKRDAYDIEVAIREVKSDTRKSDRFNLHDTHDWYKAAFWLPENEAPKKSVCDDK